MLTALDAEAVRRWCSACVESLTAHQQEIDDLNVYPVPDGDTGTNLLLTLTSAAQLLHDEPAPEVALTIATAPEVVLTLATMARGALLGARGNSGVIVSQLLRGLAEGLTAANGQAGGRARAGALGHAADLAYAAVAEPVEGTILSVARAAADAAAQAGEQDLIRVVTAAAAAAAAALDRTTLQLPALARAGVVDAGGRGLCVLLDALARIVSGQPDIATPMQARRPSRALERARESGSEQYGYEVQYLLEAADTAGLKTTLGALGDSLVIVGTGDGLWNVHVHVNDVGAAIEAGVDAGRPRRITVTRFQDQIGASTSPGWVGRAVVAVAPGEGLCDLFEAEGVVVVEGGAGANPSTAEVLAAITGTGAADVVVLPNHGNVTGVADAAAAQAREGGQDVAVVPTRSPVQGLAAVAVRAPDRRFADDVIAMAEAAAATRWAEVTVAVRDAMTTAGRCRAGDVLGLIEGDVALIGTDLRQVCIELVDRLLLSGGELVTAILGAQAQSDLGPTIEAHVAAHHPAVETTCYDGGQPHYPLLLGVE
ncbi:DAK2 domain-containing protein [soil metagenome]